MGLLSSTNIEATPANAGLVILVTLFVALLSRIFYCQFLHPLSKFPGPWYATSFSLVGAIISVKHKEPEFLMYLVKKYGSMSASFSSHKSPRSEQFHGPQMPCYALHLLTAV